MKYKYKFHLLQESKKNERGGKNDKLKTLKKESKYITFTLITSI